MASCSSGSSGKGAADSQDTVAVVQPVPQYDGTLPKGKVTDSVVCKSSPGQSFALYLPSGYTPDKQFPVIYFFDAHARGALPVRMYRDLAEKYGFVLVGSNLSKNGIPWPEANEGAKALMSETRARINIDPKRVYTSGFSGGSRVAITICILDGGVTGVIGCAAGFPKVQTGNWPKFDYFGMVGEHDFNYTEMEEIDARLAKNGYAHQLLTSGGIHGWAPAEDFNTALLWMQLCGMKAHLQPKNDSVISAFKSDVEQRIVKARKSGEWIKVYTLLDAASGAVEEPADITNYKKRLTDIAATDEYKNAVATHSQLLQSEQNQQRDLGGRFSNEDEHWWTQKIAELNKNVKGGKQQESQMSGRLLNYVGFLGYMNASYAISTGDLAKAETYLKIFKLADPKNPDQPYLAATLLMKKGNTSQAIAVLKEAAVLGYSDLGQLMTDPAFGGIKEDAAFNDVVKKVKSNYETK